MNELQIRVIETKPAIVNFNQQEIDMYLDGVLEKYKGLQFTEETAGDCKKTIADLRKVQNSLDDFRKETKKKLTESVTIFENQCKQLYGKFDTVINPLTTQYEQFENDRKDSKRKLIQIYIDTLVIDKALDSKRAVQLIILDEYLNKGKTMKAISSELSTLAASLKISQDKEAQDIELIKTKVELANSKYQLPVGLTDGAYVSMLRYKSAEEITSQIMTDAEALQKREQRFKETINVETPATAPAMQQVYSSTPISQLIPVKQQSGMQKINTEIIEVKGTDSQIDALEVFLNSNNYIWNYK